MQKQQQAGLVAIFMTVSLFAAGQALPFEFDIAHLDRTVSPKDDFYRFVNGTWEDRTEIPADSSRWDSFAALEDSNAFRIKNLLEEIAAMDAAPGSDERKIGNLYRSALDIDSINAAGISPLQPTFDWINSIQDLSDLTEYVADAHLGIGSILFGTSPLFGTYPYADQSNNERVIMQFVQGGLSLPDRDYYFDEKHAEYLPKFVEHMIKMFELAGESPRDARADANTVLAFETKLAEISNTVNERRDAANNHNLMTIDAASELLPHFPLRTYLRALGVPPTQTELDLRQKSFYIGLNELLVKEPLENLKTYLRWQALNSAATHLPQDFDEENFRFFGTELNGTPEQESRWKRASQRVERHIGFAVGKIYVARYFPPAVKQRLEEMIALMRDVLEARIKRLDWMSTETKEKALEKLNTLQVVVGYPPEWRDYSNLEISPDDYFGNIVAGARFESERLLAKLDKPFDKMEWYDPPQQVGAYYQPSAGLLVFLAGILQPPFFDPDADDAVNFGAICAVIGHEITHGFDDEGRKYDSNGNLADWWTEGDAAKFMTRAQKLVEQYNAVEVLPNVFVQGQQTLGENIADLGGTSIAYEALLRSLEGKPVELIDGFTPQQRFFMAWTQLWRTQYREDRLKSEVTSKVHSPGHVRATGPLVNMPEFFEAFDIREGDPMWRAPADRTKIW